jgi:GrpB-like predicted nucleotidyltransferase (UPF0157 family)
MAVEIHPYNEHWPVEFAHLGARLRRALGKDALRIDHIGSTSVPALAAKDIIDVQVTVSSLSDVPIGQIESLGLLSRPHIVSDHVPPLGNPSPEQWQKRYLCELDGDRPVHVHVRVAGMANQRYALLFRDYLRAHPASAAAYAELKRRLAAELTDSGTYADVKDPACDLIMQAAEAWAAAASWKPGPSDA